MALARVVVFDGVGADRLERVKGEIEGGERPEGLPATEIAVLHDPQAARALVIMFFDSEEDYARGDAVMDAMPAGDTPGGRTSVTRYDVVVRKAV
jgi:hypothetical protein